MDKKEKLEKMAEMMRSCCTGKKKAAKSPVWRNR